MRTYKTTYRERIYKRPVFRKRHIEVLGDSLPPDGSFIFEDIVITNKHKVEDLLVTITRTVEPYTGQDKTQKSG